MRTLSRLLILPAALAAMVFATGLHTGSTAEAHDYKHYVVQRSDTLFSIAARHGTTVEAIARANNIHNPNLIFVGQKLVIPGHHHHHPPRVDHHKPPSHAHHYVVQRSDTLFSIAAKHGTTVEAIARANNIHNPNLIFVGQRLIIPAAHHHHPAPPTHGHHQHVVQPGDTLFSIAAKYGTTVDRLVRANHIANPNVIHVGQVLTIR